MTKEMDWIFNIQYSTIDAEGDLNNYIIATGSGSIEDNIQDR